MPASKAIRRVVQVTSHDGTNVRRLLESPVTVFATQLNEDGTPLLSSVDWEKVVRYEPRCAAGWLLYLHRNQDICIHAVLHHLSDQFIVIRPAPRQWPAIKSSNIFDVCLDIILEPGMFTDPEPGSAFTVGS